VQVRARRVRRRRGRHGVLNHHARLALERRGQRVNPRDRHGAAAFLDHHHLAAGAPLQHHRLAAAAHPPFDQVVLLGHGE